ncbi:DNA polymerase/3'-5' exonuclease PolX [Patescibacteria group bacterium]|nr:DNA polymerase/3'-5' exonuclease PolX [Patescibacteria group bacterium]
MINQKIAKIFYQMAEYYVMDDVAFKPQAYERAGRLIESMEEDLEEIYKKGGAKALMEIEGVGQGIADKIEEFIKAGKIKEYEKLRKDCPVDLEHLSAIEGIGPKMIKVLYEKLKVKTVEDLEKAAKKHLVQKLPRFGPKVEENILRGIEFSKGDKGRFLLGYILPLARQIEKRLQDLDFVERAVAAGSIRRKKETIGDIDILAISDKPEKVMEHFCAMPEVEEIIAKGETKSSVRLDIGLDADVRVLPSESFGAALQYFTGNKDHNIVLRKMAQDKRLKLNEYGLFRGKKQVAGKTEEEVYKILGLKWMEPELRENTGEIEASRGSELPKLVGYKDVRGDLQMHSDWSDGAHSIEEMAQAAKKLGHEYIAITDHTGELRIAGGMDEKTILKYFAEIEKIDKEQKGIRILKGLEVNIRKDGSLDISDEILAKADIVLASVHSNFKMSVQDITERICCAMENPQVDIIAHPTARVIQRRSGYEVDFAKLLECAKRTGTVLEINAYPDRLDLNDVHIKKAVQAGVKLSIGTDSHSKTQLGNIELGIVQARRGWAEKKDTINTMGYEELVKFLKNEK